MRSLVTGGSGFLGSHVIPVLVAAGHEVVALARSDAAAARVRGLGATAIIGDLDEPASIDAAFAGAQADVLVNLASLGFGHAPTIVAAAEEAGITRAVFVSTTAITTRLDAPSKRVRTAAEETINRSALDWTIIRPTMIYGTAGDRNMARLLRAMRRLPVLPLPGGGRRLQQPVHVADLAAAIAAAISTDTAIGRVYDIAGPEPLSFRRLVAEAGAAVGRSPKLVPVPLRPTVTVIRLYERCSRHPKLRAEQLERLAEDKAFDIGEAKRDLGYEPRPFSVGITAEAKLV